MNQHDKDYVENQLALFKTKDFWSETIWEKKHPDGRREWIVQIRSTPPPDKKR